MTIRDEGRCERCAATIAVDYGSEPLELCHSCALAEVIELRQRNDQLEKWRSDEENRKNLILAEFGADFNRHIERTAAWTNLAASLADRLGQARRSEHALKRARLCLKNPRKPANKRADTGIERQ